MYVILWLLRCVCVRVSPSQPPNSYCTSAAYTYTCTYSMYNTYISTSTSTSSSTTGSMLADVSRVYIV